MMSIFDFEEVSKRSRLTLETVLYQTERRKFSKENYSDIDRVMFRCIVFTVYPCS